MNGIAALMVAVQTGQWTSEDWVFVSNLLLIVVTAVTAILMARDAHSAQSARDKTNAHEKEDLTELVHEVIEAEHQEEMARLKNKEPSK